MKEFETLIEGFSSENRVKIVNFDLLLVVFNRPYYGKGHHSKLN